MSERLRLGDMLVAAGLVTEAQVQEALALQRTNGERLGGALVTLGYVSEAQMTQVLSNQLSIPWANLHHVDFSRELLGRIPKEVAEKHRLVPVYVRRSRRGADTLYVAMEDPLDLEGLQLVADAAGMPVKPMVASPTDIENAIRVFYLGLPPLSASKPKVQARLRPSQPRVTERALAEQSLEDVQAAAESTPPEPAEPATATAVESTPPPAEAAPAEAPPEPEPASETTPAVVLAEPGSKGRGARVMTLTLLDGTQLRVPAERTRQPEAPPTDPLAGLTTRDLVRALTERAAGEDVSSVLSDDDWASLFAALLSTLLRGGLIADWEFIDEWKKLRAK